MVKMSELSKLIKTYKYIPEYILKEKGILYNDDNDGFNQVIKTLIKQFYAVSEWLKYKILNDNSLYLDLIHTWRNNYKDIAYISVYSYQFYQETFLLSDLLQRYKLTPEYWFTLYSLEYCELALKNIGVIDKPKLMGKSKEYNRVCDLLHSVDLGLLEKYKNVEIKKVEIKEGYLPVNTYQGLLLQQAQEISNRIENHKYRNLHKNFLNSVKRCYRNIERNPNLVSFCLMDGHKKLLKRGNNRKKKKM